MKNYAKGYFPDIDSGFSCHRKEIPYLSQKEPYPFGMDR